MTEGGKSLLPHVEGRKGHRSNTGKELRESYSVTRKQLGLETDIYRVTRLRFTEFSSSIQSPEQYLWY